MSLEIKEIKYRGTTEERVVIKAKLDCGIGDYLVVSSKKTSATAYSSTIKNPFWFPDKDVKQNDLVILYTKTGNNSVKENKDGTKSHFFYRNSSPILDTETAILLMKIANWTGAV